MNTKEHRNAMPLFKGDVIKLNDEDNYVVDRQMTAYLENGVFTVEDEDGNVVLQMEEPLH